MFGVSEKNENKNAGPNKPHFIDGMTDILVNRQRLHTSAHMRCGATYTRMRQLIWTKMKTKTKDKRTHEGKTQFWADLHPHWN